MLAPVPPRRARAPDGPFAMTTRARPRASTSPKRNGAPPESRVVDLEAQVARQNTELAIINEIGAALAQQLDFDAVVELVGERLATILSTSDFLIGLYDRSANEITFPFEIDGGSRPDEVRAPMPLGQGLSSVVLQTKSPLRINTTAEAMAAGAVLPAARENDTPLTESWLGVPILAGDAAIGLVVFGDYRPNLFTEGDERLVSTVASSMGVALENARLFAETKRLLAETDARAAELALVNEIG